MTMDSYNNNIIILDNIMLLGRATSLGFFSDNPYIIIYYNNINKKIAFR